MTRSIPVKSSRPHVRHMQTHCPVLLAELRMNVDVERAVETDDGEVAGAGYCITKPGQVVARLEAA